ncbi:PorP/SprF family type IX secretion system membrane protein [Lutibacter sp.]
MKKIKLVLGVLAFMSLTTVFGQQDAQYTQYMYNMNVLNPAYAGSKGITSIGLLGRTQWVGVEGAPRTVTLAMHSPIGKAVGLGLSIIHDEIGPVKEDNIYVDFSYTIFTSDEGRLAFGLKAGVSFLNVREFITVDPDPLNIPINQTSPNFGAGLYYYTNKFYLGLSAPNFIETKHLEKGGGTVSTASEKMHYFLTSGYVFDIADNLKLKPSTMIKATAGAPISVDLSLNLLVDERVELGLSHRFDDSISALIGFQVNEDFRIGYAYDYTTTRFGDFNSGSHEILLLFDFNRKNVKSPRFF